MDKHIRPTYLNLYRLFVRVHKPYFKLFLMALFSVGLATSSALVEAESSNAIHAPLAPQSLLLDVFSIGNRLITVGERGHILLSDDEGQSWQQAQVPTRATLTAVFFLNEQMGWAVGHDATILRSTDAGLSWQQVHAAPEQERPLLDIWFVDQSYGIAVGAYGLYMETHDGGLSWDERLISEDDYHLNKIVMNPHQIFYIVGEAGAIYRSDDQGKTWVTLDLPYQGSLFAATVLNENTIIVAGLRGHLFVSQNRGEDWQVIESATNAMLTDMIVTDDDQILIVGLDGTVLIINSQGIVESYEQPDRKGITTITRTETGKLFIAGERGIRSLSITDLNTHE